MFGPELDLLELHDLLPLARLVLLLLLLELELAVVEDLADGRIRVRNDLNQIQAGLFGGFERGGGRHHALLLAVLIDQQNAGNADIFVHARPVLDGRRLHRTANRQCSGTVETQKTPGRATALRSFHQYMTRGASGIKARARAEATKELAACATCATGRSARFSARRIGHAAARRRQRRVGGLREQHDGRARRRRRPDAAVRCRCRSPGRPGRPARRSGEVGAAGQVAGLGDGALDRVRQVGSPAARR